MSQTHKPHDLSYMLAPCIRDKLPRGTHIDSNSVIWRCRQEIAHWPSEKWDGDPKAEVILALANRINREDEEIAARDGAADILLAIARSTLPPLTPAERREKNDDDDTDSLYTVSPTRSRATRQSATGPNQVLPEETPESAKISNAVEAPNAVKGPDATKQTTDDLENRSGHAADLVEGKKDETASDCKDLEEIREEKRGEESDKNSHVVASSSRPRRRRYEIWSEEEYGFLLHLILDGVPLMELIRGVNKWRRERGSQPRSEWSVARKRRLMLVEHGLVRRHGQARRLKPKKERK